MTDTLYMKNDITLYKWYLIQNILMVSIIFWLFMWLFYNRNFVEESLGCRYVETTRIEFEKSYEESSPSTPVFFVLSPGVNPLKDVETLGMFYNQSRNHGIDQSHDHRQ